jgi:adenylate kinase family enzyme
MSADKRSQRIYITGPSGAGSTTLASELSRICHLKHLDSDRFFWRPTDPPYIQMTPAEERNQKLLSELESGRFVVSGDVSVWGIEESFLANQFEAAIFFIRLMGDKKTTNYHERLSEIW